MPGRKAVTMPRTLKRSPPKAQRTYAKAKRSAERTYGSGERAARTAYAALKHGFEKVGDHWEAKARKGPSDDQAARSVSGRQSAARAGKTRTAGGVDVLGHTREQLYRRARGLGIRGASRMNKGELGRAIADKQD